MLAKTVTQIVGLAHFAQKEDQCKQKPAPCSTNYKNFMELIPLKG